MSDTNDLRKLKDAIDAILKDLGFDDTSRFAINVTDDDDLIEFIFGIKPEALVGAEEREMLRDFDSIVSGIELSPQEDPAQKKLRELKEQHREDWTDE